MEAVPHPPVAVVLVALAYVAASSIFAILIASTHRKFNPGPGLLHWPDGDRRESDASVDGDIQRGRRGLLLGGLSDPKTVRPRRQPPRRDGSGLAAAAGKDRLASIAYPGRASSATPPYDVDNCLLAAGAFQNSLFFFIYDPLSDVFVAVHNTPGCRDGCERIFRVGGVVSHALRSNFPERFRQGEDGLVLMLSVGDVPRVRPACLRGMIDGDDRCRGEDLAPVLHFGSAFADPAVPPGVVAMPLPVRPHVTCFGHWQARNRLGERGPRGQGRRALFYVHSTGKDSSVCQDLRPRIDFEDDSRSGGLVFGEELGLIRDENYWENLVPQVVWRGTDFSFLHSLFPEMRAPSYELDIAPLLDEAPANDRDRARARWAIETLWNMGGTELLPRWRGVLLTSMAELEAAEHEEFVGEQKLPWANIKFATVGEDGEKVSALDYSGYHPLRELGITAAGEYMNMTQLAGYKYHIDIGGGGGTTWTGTIDKLALPGLLFHHVTPTKDWFHDILVPWIHYVPVSADLSDLRERFEWAEANPADARRIAEEATRLARWMGTSEGFARLYEDHLVSPLRNVIGAYRAPPPRYGDASVLDIVSEAGAQWRGFSIVAKCSGIVANSCQKVV